MTDADSGPTPELEPSPEAMRRMVDEAMDRITEHIVSLPQQPAAYEGGGAELARSLSEPMPEKGAPLSEILDRLFDRALAKSFNSAGPGYLAYIPGGGLFAAAVAGLLADAVNRYVGVFAAAPGLVQLEADTVRWLADIVGLPAGSGGFLTSGGSLAHLSAIISVRRERLPEDFLAGTLYQSDQTHHSVAKAALLAGFPRDSLRTVPSDASYRIRLDALEAMIAEDRAAGRTPFLIVANAGTTNTGAVDPLPELAAMARRHRLWLHVDAAYGGLFALTRRGARILRGLGEADSLVVDPHKGLFLPFGVGALLVRDPEVLRRTHSLGAAYLPRMQEDRDLIDFCEISPELTRPFRGLKVWLPLELYGIGAFRRALDEKLDLATWIHERLTEIPELKVLAPPQLTTLAFALERPGESVESANGRTRELLRRINARRRVYLTPTLLGDRFAIRISILSFRTHRRRVEMCLEDLRRSLEELGTSAAPETRRREHPRP